MGRYPDLLQHPSRSECKGSIVGRVMKEVVRETGICRSDRHVFRTKLHPCQTCVLVISGCSCRNNTRVYSNVLYSASHRYFGFGFPNIHRAHIKQFFFLDRAPSVVGVGLNLSEESHSPMLPRGKTRRALVGTTSWRSLTLGPTSLALRAGGYQSRDRARV